MLILIHYAIVNRRDICYYIVVFNKAFENTGDNLLCRLLSSGHNLTLTMEIDQRMMIKEQLE